MILDGKELRNKLLEKYKELIENEHLDLTLAIIYIGNDSASEVYINNKIKYCSKVGIKTKLIRFDGDVLESDVVKEIKNLNNDNSITGIIVQSPIPDSLNFDNIVQSIDSNKDVDGFTKENFYKLTHNINGLRPCTAKGIMRLLEEYDIDVTSKNVCILGRGNLVGKPLLFEMLNHNATIDICHSKTVDLSSHTKRADIIVCGCGQAHILKEDMIRDGAIVIDAGITVEDGQIIGDADYNNIKDKCSYITPNPGGVGPMTIAMIIENVIEASRLQ